MKAQESKKLEKKILDLLQKHLKKNETIIIGVSGGADSVFLLHLLAKLPLKRIVAHIDHQLRKDSAKDEIFVKNLATKTESLFYSTTQNIKSLSAKNKKGIEELGREVRYNFFKKLAKEHKANWILTAHHADDNLETIIGNLTRGSNLQGLSGMQLLSPPLFRPLLDITKDQILSYLKAHKIKFREDKTNANTIYKRNHIRHKILPKLKKINPNLAETLSKNTKNLREINDFLTQEAHNWLKTQKPTQLDAKKFRTLHPALQKTILIQLHQNLTASTKNLENTHLDEVLTLINQNIGNKKKKFGNLLISINRNTITIEKTLKKVHY